MPAPLHEVIRATLVEVAAARETITYEALLDAIEAHDPDLRQQAEADLSPALRAVSIAEDEAARGLLTAVVVRSGSGVPGAGFFRLAAGRGRDCSDPEAAWTDELARVHDAHSGGGSSAGDG